MTTSRVVAVLCITVVAGRLATTGGAVFAQEKPASAEQTLNLTGTLEPYEQTMLYAKVSGYLKKLHVDIGDEVKEGDVIADIFVPEMEPQLRYAESAVDTARARVEKAKADARLAASTYRRIAEIRSKEPGAATPQDEDVAQAQSSVADAQVAVVRTEQEAAEAKVSELKAMIEYTTIRAPFSGLITSRLLDTGALVVSGASNGKAVAEIMRQDVLRLVVYLPEAAVPYVTKDHAATVEFDASPGAKVDAKIVRLSQSLAPDTRSMRAEIDIENTDGALRPGMYAKVRIEYSRAEKSK